MAEERVPLEKKRKRCRTLTRVQPLELLGLIIFRPCTQENKKCSQGSPVLVQWLRIHLAMQGIWVQSLFSELRSHILQGN